MQTITKQDIITKLGGPSEVARLCGITPGAVSQWEDIPSKHQPTILDESKRRKLGISAEQIVMCARRSEAQA